MTEPAAVEVVQAPSLEDIGALLETQLEANSETIRSEMDARIAELAKPIAREVIQMGVEVSRHQPTDRLYARLPKEVREWRNAASDHYMANWIRGLAGQRVSIEGFDPETSRKIMREANDKLGTMFGRATSLEGVPDADGGIADGTAGDLIPVPLLNVILINRDIAAKMRGLAQNFELTNQQARIPTAGQATAAMVAEGATAAQGEPPFASVLPRANKMQAIMKASIEAIADSAFNLVSLYAARAGTAMGALEDVQFCTSDGVAPNVQETIFGGLFVEDTLTVLTYPDVVGLYRAVPQIYRPNAVWMAGSVVLTLLDTLLDGNSRPIFSMQDAVVLRGDDDAEGTIFRKRVFEMPLPDGQLLFGDPLAYGVGTRQGIVASVSEHVDFLTDLVVFKFTQRIEGVMLDQAGIKQMVDLATVA